MVNYPTMSEVYMISQSGVGALAIWIDGENLCNYTKHLTRGINTLSYDAIDSSM